MRTRSFHCDTGRLRSFLDDGLDEDERAGLADHLETCRSCQGALERLAAGSGFWRSLGQLAHPRPASTTPGGSRGPVAAGPGSRPDHDEDDEALDFLAPPSGPGQLGLLGPYEITGVLGRGGMGIVLKAYDPALNRVVAIKVLAPQLASSGAARKRFAREARAAAAVVHEHVIAIHAVESWNGLPYLVMPYLAGGSLQDRIDRDGPLEVKEVLRIGMQAAQGLAAAHAQGLVHRDVKPSNILLENGVERVWLTDFGLARAADDASLTQTGVVAGTPHYMAPEQARGEAFDHRADLFSLGSVLYAMCTGHPPFRAGTTLAVLRRVSEEQPRPLREVDAEVPAWLASVVAKLHAKAPAHRYQSAGEVADVLGRRLAELQRPPARAARRAAGAEPKPVGGPPRRRPGVLAVATAALAVLVAALGAAEFAGLTRLGDRLALVARDGGAADSPGAGDPAGVIPAREGGDEGPIVGSGKSVTKDLGVGDFENLEVVHPFRVEVVRADGFGVTVAADDNVIGHVKAIKEGSTLTIALEEGKSYRLKADSLKAKVSMPALAGIGLSHGARGTVRGFKSDRGFKAGVTHGSALEGEVEAGDVVLEASHGSGLALKGRARDGRVTASHGSRLILAELALRAVDVVAEHGSTVSVNARSGERFGAKAAHGSTLSGSVEAGDVTVEAEHGSRATLKGSARKADLKADHGSRLALGGLALDSAEVELGRASSATVNARNALDYGLDHGSSLKYLGHPKVGRSESSRSSSARSISAAEAEREEAAFSKEPAKRAGLARGNGEIVIRIGGGGDVTVQIGDIASGTIVGSGKPATKRVDVSGFNAVEARGPCVVEVTRGDAFRVILTADDNVLQRLKAVEEGGTLRIVLEEGNYRLIEPPKATVIMPAIEGVTLGGAARAKLQGFDSDRPFRARLSGAARLEGSLKAGDIALDVDGASRASLSGSARGLELKATGASRLDLNDLAAATADVVLDGASRVTVNARERLGYSVKGVSRLEYSGDPAIRRAETSGISKVSRRR